jgi:hypothetical protein
MAVLRAFIVVLLATSLSFAQATDSKDAAKIPKTCNSAKEFEKAYVYFTTKEEVQLIDSQALQLAVRVSEGCDGAQERFNKVFQTLKKSGIEFNQVKELALKFSQKSDSQTDTFLEFYKKIFLENYLDLDFHTAYKVSLKFAEKSQDETTGLAKDFERIVSFCLSQKKMGLPLKTCADFAFELADFRPLWGSKSMADDLEEFYDFVLSRKDLEYNTSRFIKWTRQVMRSGPAAVENFKQAFDFARRQGLTEQQSVEVAAKVAANSLDKKSLQ